MILKNKRVLLLSLSCLSGLIFAAAWPARGFPGLLFLAFIPLLFLEQIIFHNRSFFSRYSVLFYTYPAFFIWNLLTIWWIYNSTGIGALMAIALNALFMAFFFQLFHFSKVRFKSSISGYACLVFYWISFEFIHLNWNIINWPWLNIGNGFSSFYHWVQWYEYTGAEGGTLWVLIANILGFEVLNILGIRHLCHCELKPRAETPSEARGLRRGREATAFSRRLFVSGAWVLWIIIPILMSYLIYFNYKEEKHPINVVVIQPNLDPYQEQYSVPPPLVIGRIQKLANPLIDSSVNFLVAPESAIQERMWENDLRTFESIRLLKDMTVKYPGLNIIVGGSTFYEFPDNNEITTTARKFTDVDRYYDAYNAAIVVNALDTLQLYHKSKLTPGVEILPSFKGFKWFENFAIDLGGTVGSLATDKVRKVFQTVHAPKASAVICYESVFGEFFSEFVRNGAEVMMIITNDGWWGNTGGHRQHYEFSHLRAIETRRCIARSANTGISAFIDQRGDAHSITKYWEPAAIKGTLNANTKLTFYTQHGDYIARFSVLAGIILLLTSILIQLKFIRSFINHS